MTGAHCKGCLADKVMPKYILIFTGLGERLTIKEYSEFGLLNINNTLVFNVFNLELSLIIKVI